jgi:hypothetical protein
LPANEWIKQLKKYHTRIRQPKMGSTEVVIQANRPNI